MTQTQKFDCQLEIDNERGVIYIHSVKTGQTLLRICSLPKPIPRIKIWGFEMLDITHMVGTSWKEK